MTDIIEDLRFTIVGLLWAGGPDQWEEAKRLGKELVSYLPVRDEREEEARWQ